jgi:hypothetical protein
MSAHVGSWRSATDRIVMADGRFRKKRTRVDVPCDREALGTDQLASALLLTEKKYAR